MPRLVLVAACALIDPDKRVLIATRPQGKPMAGLWRSPPSAVTMHYAFSALEAV
jgi:8-oxo-dGTP diphosphatase